MLLLNQTKDYLKRLGTEIQPPTKEFLFELHRAHVERISWQTINIFAGKPVPIDFKSSIHHILNHGSGYCFHLNGAFSLLLRSLGYKVSLHKAGVQSRSGEPRIDLNHLGLSVDMLDDSLEPQRWIVDVGLGDMLYEPLPLVFGEYCQEPHTYKVCKSEVAVHGWRLEHDPLGTFAGVDFDPEDTADMEEFNPMHHYLSASPDSVWINLLIVQNRHRAGSNELRGCLFSQRNGNGIVKSEITNRSSWFELLSDVFGEQLNQFSKQEKDELWTKVIRTHEEWKIKK